MSPEKENGHSSDSLDSTDSLKGKEVSPWLLNLMNDRMLPMSSRSRMNLTMPPIVTSIWRKIGHLSPQAVRLPILQRVSIPVLTKAPSLSTVWRRLLELPLLRRRQKRTNKHIQASHVAAEVLPHNNVYLSPDEALSNEYSQNIPAIAEEQFTSEPGESATGEYIQRMPMVAEGQPVDAADEADEADEAYPMIIDKIPSRLADIIKIDKIPSRTADIVKQPYKDDSTNKSVYPSSVVQWSKQITDRSRPADASNRPLLPVDRTTAPESEHPGQIQESVSKDIRHTEDIQSRPGEYPQPVYQSRDSADISLSPSVEPGLEYVERMLPAFSEQSPPAYSSQGLRDARLPTTEEPVVSSGTVAKPSIATRLSTPLIHSLPVLQRLYLKTIDKAVELSSKVMQLPYAVSNFGTQKATAPDRKPAPSLDSYRQPTSQQVEDNLPYSSPDQGVPAESRRVFSDYQPVDDSAVIKDVDKSVPDVLSPGIEKRDASLIVPGSNDIISRRVLEAHKPGKGLTPTSPLAPLSESWVERYITGKTVEDSESISQDISTDKPQVLPAGKNDMPADFPTTKPEILHPPTDLPSATELHREIVPEKEGVTGISTSPVQKYFRLVKDIPIESSVRQSIMRREIIKPAAGLPGYIYRSLDLLFTAPAKSGKVLDAMGLEGVSPGAFEGRMDYLSQPTGGPVSSLDQYSEEVSPEQSVTQTRRHAEAMPPQLSLAQARSYARAIPSGLPLAQTGTYARAIPSELPIAQAGSYARAIPSELPLTQAKSYTGAMPPEQSFAQRGRYPDIVSPEMSVAHTSRYTELALPELPVAQTKSYAESPSEPAFILNRGRIEAILPETGNISRKSKTEDISLLAAPGTEETTEETTGEGEAGIDLDAIARDVYRILKRRLYRERERAFGLS